MRSLVVVALAALLPLTACSDDAGSGEATTVAGDFVAAAERSTGDGAGSVDGASAPDRPVLLQMPQVAVRLDAVAVADRVDVDSSGVDGAGALPDGDVLAAPGGGDLVLVDLTLTPGAFAAAPEASKGGPWTLEAVVDGEPRPVALDVPLGPGAAVPVTVAVAAAADAPVLLQVSDAGRSARIDLRARAAADDAVSQAVSGLGGAVSDLGEAQDVEGTAESEVETFESQIVGPSKIVVRAVLDQATAGAYAWVPGEGWAARGRQWLVLEVPVTVVGIIAGASPTLSVPAGAITATAASGRPARSRFALRATATAVLDGTASPLVFEVPQSRSYRVRVDVGRGTLPGSRWVRRPDAVDVTVRLAP